MFKLTASFILASAGFAENERSPEFKKGFEQGSKHAAEEISEGFLYLHAYDTDFTLGKPNDHYPLLLKEKYGIHFKSLGLSPEGDEKDGYSRGFNDAMTSSIEKKYGEGILLKTQEEAGYIQGKKDAEEELAAGKLALETMGLAPVSRNAVMDNLRENYGIELRAVAGCIVSPTITGHARGFNEVMTVQIEKRHGAGVMEKVENEAIALLKDNQKIEPESPASRFVKRYEGNLGENRIFAYASKSSKSFQIDFYYLEGQKMISLDFIGEEDGMLTFRQYSPEAFYEKPRGDWNVRIEGDNREAIKGDFISSVDGAKETLPIDLTESYLDSSVRFDVYYFESSWAKENGLEKAFDSEKINLLQIRGESDAINQVNANMRFEALSHAKLGAIEGYEDNPLVSLADISLAVERPEPTEIDWLRDQIKQNRSLSMRVALNEAHVLSVRAYYETYLGGAHGLEGYRHLNYDLTSGKKIQITDLVKDGYKERWTPLIEAKLRERINESPDTPLSDCRLMPDIGRVPPSDNWFLSTSGIGFTYNPYQIAPYSEGIISVVLPWAEIAGDLKNGGLLNRLMGR